LRNLWYLLKFAWWRHRSWPASISVCYEFCLKMQIESTHYASPDRHCSSRVETDAVLNLFGMEERNSSTRTKL
jgi:hypothetical protein